MLWLDGYSVGDNQWFTYGYRDLDQNNDPRLMPDLSYRRVWFSEHQDTNYQVVEPNRRQFPLVFDMPADFCADDSTQLFFLTGKFLIKGESKSPQIIFRMNKTTEVFHWDFRLGNFRYLKQQFNCLFRIQGHPSSLLCLVKI